MDNLGKLNIFNNKIKYIKYKDIFAELNIDNDRHFLINLPTYIKTKDNLNLEKIYEFLKTINKDSITNYLLKGITHTDFFDEIHILKTKLDIDNIDEDTDFKSLIEKEYKNVFPLLLKNNLAIKTRFIVLYLLLNRETFIKKINN